MAGGADDNAAVKLQALLALRAAQGYVPPEPIVPAFQYGLSQGPPSTPPQMTINGASEFVVYLDEHVDFYSLPTEQQQNLSNQRERLADLLLAGAKKMFGKMGDYDARVAAGTAYPYQAPPETRAPIMQQTASQVQDPAWLTKMQEMQSQFPSPAGSSRPASSSKTQPATWQNNFAQSAATSDASGVKRKKDGQEEGGETKRVAFALAGKIAPKNPQTGKPQLPSSETAEGEIMRQAPVRRRSRSASRDLQVLEKHAGYDPQYLKRSSTSSRDSSGALQGSVSLYEQNRELLRKARVLESDQESTTSRSRKPSPCRVQHTNTAWDKPPVLKTPSPERDASRSGNSVGSTAALAQPSKKVCMRFLNRNCFDDNCLFWHPTTEFEIARELSNFTQTPCLYGRKCKKDNCLFKHPQPGEPDFDLSQRDYKTFHNFHEKQKPQPNFMSVSL